MPCFVTANLREHRSALLELNVEYVSWVFAGIDAGFGVRCTEIVGMEVPDYVASMLDKICDRAPPDGVFYLIDDGTGRFAGMGGLRRLGTDCAEIKRLYVRPALRGGALGRRLLHRLLADARAFGYRHVCLDSAPFMNAAHHLYEAAGFVDRGPYPDVEVPEPFHARWRFMELALAPPGQG